MARWALSWLAYSVRSVQISTDRRQRPDRPVTLQPMTKTILSPWSRTEWPVPQGAYLVPTLLPEGEGLSYWLPFGAGWEIPVAFEYYGSGLFDWSIWIHVLDGVAECVDLRCSGADGQPVTATALRQLPIARLVQQGVLLASRPAEEIPRQRVMWKTVEEAQEKRDAVAKHHGRVKRNPHQKDQVTDELLEEVATIYRAELAGGRPTARVAETLHYSRSSAGRLVMEARNRGLLPKTDPRKARG